MLGAHQYDVILRMRRELSADALTYALTIDHLFFYILSVKST